MASHRQAEPPEHFFGFIAASSSCEAETLPNTTASETGEITAVTKARSHEGTRSDGFPSGVAPHRIARARARKAVRIWAYEKLALRPLGFGRTNTCAPSNRSPCRPQITCVAARAPNRKRYSVTPTRATISGL